MSMDKGKSSIGTPCGAICSLIMLIVILMYAVQKTAILINKGDSNLQNTRLENYFDFQEPMTGAEDGIFFAFRVYNSLRPLYDRIDSSYYTIYVNNLEYKIDEETGSKVADLIEITTHPCTESELK